tara:strand:- start:511 stop:678 length:168 start_codon:yes stop_codon:yes gene_type:complete
MILLYYGIMNNNMGELLISLAGFLGLYSVLGIFTYILMNYLARVYALVDFDEDFD